jgi:tRNA threonylcarbamoyladenosine biosynthesis protein TsaE
MDVNTTYRTETSGETSEIGRTLADSIVTRQKAGERDQAVVLCLNGDLGSGKTTFVQGFAKGLGITSRLLSPTFIIVRRYIIPVSGHFLYHVDLYRTKTRYDIENLGISEMLADRDAFVLIEWAEKLKGDLLPRDRTDIHFTVNGDESHTIIIGRQKT